MAVRHRRIGRNESSFVIPLVQSRSSHHRSIVAEINGSHERGALQCRTARKCHPRNPSNREGCRKLIGGLMTQTQGIVAEQTSRNLYRQDPQMAPREIELTIRLEIPEEIGADVGINPSFDASLPSEWEDTLTQRIYQGVHGGLASVDAPLPEGGLSISITHLRLSPPVSGESTSGEVRRLGDALEALTASTVAALWAGVISFSAPSAR